MGKNRTVAAWGLLVGVLLAGVSPAAERRDVLANGGFEDGFRSWIPASGHALDTQPGAAFAGRNCLMGEVTEPDKHLSIRQTVTVRAGCRYEFQVAARATNRTKLVLFAVWGGQRTNVAIWEAVPRAWTEYRTPLVVAQDGELQLEIVAPSSHNAPAGRIWVDDVRLWETSLPPLVSVSDDEGFNDEPAMVRADDGALYVAWVSYRDLSDSLQVTRLVPQDGRLVRAGSWQLSGGAGTYVLGPAVVGAGAKVYVLYAAEVNKDWDVFAVECGPGGPGRSWNVSRQPGVDVNPAGAWREGQLRLVWESNGHGRRRVFCATLAGDGPSAPEAVSAEEYSSYDPTVAVLANGDLCAAWHSFRDNNYDIYFRRKISGADWGPEVRLTRAPAVDRHPSLLALNNEPLLAYENAQVEKYYVGRTDSRRVVVAKVHGDQLLGLPDPQQSPLWGRCEAPALAADASGRIWVAYRQPRPPRAGWDVFWTCFDGRRWRAPEAVSLDKGLDRRPALARCGDGWAVAFQTDNMPASWSDVDLTPTAKSNVVVALLDPGPLPEAGVIGWEPLVEPAEAFEAAGLRVARGEDNPTPRIEYDGRAYQLYFGDLHQHSDVSVCNRLGDQSIEEDYQFSRVIQKDEEIAWSSPVWFGAK